MAKSNLILDHLRAIRGDMAKMADWMQIMSIELAAIRQSLAQLDRLKRT